MNIKIISGIKYRFKKKMFGIVYNPNQEIPEV